MEEDEVMSIAQTLAVGAQKTGRRRFGGGVAGGQGDVEIRKVFCPQGVRRGELTLPRRLYPVVEDGELIVCDRS